MADLYAQYVKDMKGQGLLPVPRAQFEEAVAVRRRPRFSPEAEEVISGVSRAMRRSRELATDPTGDYRSGVTRAEIGPRPATTDQGVGIRALKFWNRFGDINKALDKVLKRGK